MINILAVVENRKIYKDASTFFETDSEKFLIANTLQKALGDLKSNNFDILIIDNMKKPNRSKILQYIEEKNKNIKLIIIDCAEFNNNILKNFKIKPFNYLSKPLKKSQFYSTLKNAIRITQLEKKQKLDVQVNNLQENLLRLLYNINCIFWSYSENDDSINIAPYYKNIGQNANKAGDSPYTFEKISQQDYLKKIHPQDIKKVKESRKKLVNNMGKYDIEYRIIKDGRNKDKDKDKGNVWVRDRAFSVYVPQKKAKQIIGVIQDITEDKQFEAKMKQNRKLQDIGQLTEGIAHDFKNLLTPIIGYTDILISDTNPRHLSYHKLVEIKKAAEVAKNLTQQLVAFSRNQELDMQIISVKEVIENFVEILKRVLRDNIKIEIPDNHTLYKIKANSAQIDQILLNLAINAQDAMPNGGKLIINIDSMTVNKHNYPSLKEGQYVLLSITDNGTGIEKKDLKNIFEPFFTTKEKEHGTGLGLSTVYDIVKQHNGIIEVSSQVNKGTTFNILLPKVDEQVTRRLKTLNNWQSKCGTEIIFIVEDEEMIRSMLTNVLKNQRYSVYSAGSAEECLEFKKKKNNMPLDLLITDVILPNIDGKQLGQLLKSFYPNLKILYMSAYTDKVTKLEEFGLVKPHFIQKPFRMKSLIEKVREILDS